MDDISAITVCLQALSTPADDVVPPTSDHRRPLSRKLSRIQIGLKRVSEAVPNTDAPVEHSLLIQSQEELSDYKRDLAVLYDELIAKDIGEEDELSIMHSTLERELSDASRKIKGSLMATPIKSTSTPIKVDGTGVKLPKLDIPTFDGNVIHWK